MKKIVITIFLIAPLFAITSCNDWLDVSSTKEITGDQLFETDKGTKDAIMGIYITLAKGDLYGKALTWHHIDILGQPFQINIENAEAYSLKLSNTSSRSKESINAIWLQFYYAIASINNALDLIEKNKGVLNSREEAWIKGELYGLRAFLHFDIMRIFGYGDLQARNYMDRLTIPYVTKYSKDETEQLSYSQTIDLMISDVNRSLDLLENEPIVSDEDYSELNFDGFWNDRNYRMNYYAAKALLARIYMWEGSNKSLEEANKIAEELTKLEGKAYSWVSSSDIEKPYERDRDKTFSSEHLFAIDVYNSQYIFNEYMVDPAFSAELLTSYIQPKMVNWDMFTSFINAGTTVYAPNHPSADETGLVYFATAQSGPGNADYRLANHVEESPTMNVYYYNKLYQPDKYASKSKNRIPLIKISEMYYIMAEYQLRVRQDKEATLRILNDVVIHRGWENGLDEDFVISADAELTREYMREFVSEGQLFYYLKRRNIIDPTNYNASSGYAGEETYQFTDEQFLLPYPDNEIIYGNRVQ